MKEGIGGSQPSTLGLRFLVDHKRETGLIADKACPKLIQENDRVGNGISPKRN